MQEVGKLDSVDFIVRGRGVNRIKAVPLVLSDAPDLDGFALRSAVGIVGAHETTRLELADNGAAGVPLFVGATDAEGDDGLRMTRTSAEAYARARGYMPPKTPQSGAVDKLDNDSVAGDDIAGDVY